MLCSTTGVRAVCWKSLLRTTRLLTPPRPVAPSTRPALVVIPFVQP